MASMFPIFGWNSESCVAYYAAAFAIIYFVATTAHQWYRLRSIPGPFLAGFTNLWLSWTFAKGKETPFYDFDKKYGHLVRVAPNLLFTDDPEQLRKMAGARSNYGKDTMYHAHARHSKFRNMFTTTDVAEHDRIKAKLLGPYSGRTTQGMEPIVDGFVTLLIKQLRGRINTDKPRAFAIVDLARFSMYFTMDVITRLAFGEELGFLASDSDRYNLLANLRRAVKVMWLPIVDSNVRTITTSSIFFNLLGKRSMLGLLQSICEESVKRRYQPGAPEEKDLLGALIKEGFQEGECISEKNLISSGVGIYFCEAGSQKIQPLEEVNRLTEIDIVMFALGAGSDTTGSTIRGTMLQLITNPRVYLKLKETVAQAVSQGLVSSPIKQEEAKKLSYLQAVILEGIRMRPAVPLLFNKTVPPQGDVINGMFVPGGTAVGWNLLTMMRSPEHWGPDAGVFRPERFMEADEKTRASMERLVDLAFGYGKFGCAGKPLAFMELNKVFFELFRHFDFQLVNPAEPWISEFYTVFMETDFLVEITESSLSSISTPQ